MLEKKHIFIIPMLLFALSFTSTLFGSNAVSEAPGLISESVAATAAGAFTAAAGVGATTSSAVATALFH